MILNDYFVVWKMWSEMIGDTLYLHNIIIQYCSCCIKKVQGALLSSLSLDLTFWATVGAHDKNIQYCNIIRDCNVQVRLLNASVCTNTNLNCRLISKRQLNI